MKYLIKGFFMILFFSVFLSPTISYCQVIKAEDIVDQFDKATDVQQDEIKKLYEGTEIMASGIIANVAESRLFNDAEKIEGSFYTVATEIQKTSAGNPYQTVFFYKKADEVNTLNKGEGIEKKGKLLKIVDKGLWLGVWIQVE